MKYLYDKLGLRPPETGHSLIELVIVISLIVLLAAFSMHAIIASADLYVLAVRDYLGTFQQAKIGMERMSREIRDTDAHSITTSPGSITFTKKYGHGTPQDPSLDVGFIKSDGQISRHSADGHTALIENVVSFSTSLEQGVVTLDLTIGQGDRTLRLRTAVRPEQ